MEMNPTGSRRGKSQSGTWGPLDVKPIEKDIIVMSWVGSFVFVSFSWK